MLVCKIDLVAVRSFASAVLQFFPWWNLLNGSDSIFSFGQVFNYVLLHGLQGGNGGMDSLTGRVGQAPLPRLEGDVQVPGVGGDEEQHDVRAVVLPRGGDGLSET